MRSQAHTGRGKNSVALLERPYICAGLFDLAGKLLSEHTYAWLEQTEPQPHRQPDPAGKVEPAQLAVRRGHSCGADSYEDLVGFRGWLLNLPDLKNFWRPIICAYDSFHESLRFWVDYHPPLYSASTLYSIAVWRLIGLWVWKVTSQKLIRTVGSIGLLLADHILGLFHHHY